VPASGRSAPLMATSTTAGCDTLPAVSVTSMVMARELLSGKSVSCSYRTAASAAASAAVGFALAPLGSGGVRRAAARAQHARR
jgi:hypothetical protein